MNYKWMKKQNIKTKLKGLKQGHPAGLILRIFLKRQHQNLK